MKKTVRLALVLIMALALSCSVAALCACDNNDIVDLRVEGAKISFMRGDVFETGEDFAVYAEYKDGTSVDVTDQVELRQENGMDMNVAGDYQITVVYGQKRTIYTIYVNDSEDVLRKIELNTDNVNKNYKLGDAVSFEGIELNLTYENAQKVLFTERTNSLSGFNVAVVDGKGNAIDGIFTSLGTFTVIVSKSNVQASYSVTVDGVNVSTVQGALTVGKFYAGNVALGTALIEGARSKYDSASGLKPGEAFTSSVYEYAFGNGYTYIKDTHNSPVSEYHCGLDEDGFFVVYLEDGVIKTSNRNNAAMMNGAPILLWYSYETVYGAENALNVLYSHALRCSNDDLKETADESTRTYSFSFSGLESRDRNSDYYETTVNFTLGEDYSISYFKFTQDYYENNEGWSGQPGYSPTFITDPSTGKTAPNGDYSYRTIVTVTQTAGERTAENEYNREMFNISSYKLSYNGEELEEGATLNLNAGGTYTLVISDILPTTADLSVDIMQFDYEGNLGSGDFWIDNEDFSLTRKGTEITLSARRGGKHTLIFRTADTVRTLVVEITGEAPEDMSPKLYNGVSKSFYDGNEKTVSVGGDVYFYGAVTRYSNAAQTAVITSENDEYVTITPVTLNGVACWKFTATQAGTYHIMVKSDVAPLTNCTFVFQVTETADFASLLTGTYETQDRVGDIYRVSFNLTDADNIGGTVTVTRTPTDSDGNPVVAEAETLTLNFSLDDVTIVVDNNSSNAFWVEFVVDANGNLELVDQRDDRYVLTRTTDN